MTSRTFPGASTTAQWFQDNYNGQRFPLPIEKLVVHTTETVGWPGYNGGASAPNATARPGGAPGNQKLGWRAHFYGDCMARALQNDSGGVQTNAESCHQIELCGTCDPKTAKAWRSDGYTQGEDFIFWPDAPDWALHEVAKYLAWAHTDLGLRLVSVPIWLPYPDSYGEKNGVRLAGSGWQSYRGVVGHQHVPENDHGDPGSTDVPAIVAYANKILNPESADMPLTSDDLNKIRTIVKEETGKAVWSTKFVEYENPDGGERENQTCSHILFRLDQAVQHVEDAVAAEPVDPAAQTAQAPEAAPPKAETI